MNTGTFAATVLLVFTVGCGSASQPSRPANFPQPEMDVRLAHSIFFGSGSSAPANIEIEVLNRASTPLVVRRVEVDSPGMIEYTLRRTVRDFRETIAPGQSKTMTVFAIADTMTSRPTETLTVRAVIEMQAEGKTWREYVQVR
jgi:hypothetical protein